MPYIITISLDGLFGPVEPYSSVLDYDDMRESALSDQAHRTGGQRGLEGVKTTLRKGVGVVPGMAGEQ
jgi:hypothetical protein